jgi:hypothetical protein
LLFHSLTFTFTGLVIANIYSLAIIGLSIPFAGWIILFRGLCILFPQSSIQPPVLLSHSLHALKTIQFAALFDSFARSAVEVEFASIFRSVMTES